jgi:hypothetical protein
LGGALRVVMMRSAKPCGRVKRPKINCLRVTESQSKFEMKIFSTYFEFATRRCEILRAFVAK